MWTRTLALSYFLDVVLSHHGPGHRHVLQPRDRVRAVLERRQDCYTGDVPCGGKCMPEGAVCCGPDGYCDAGQLCWPGAFCCNPGDVVCGDGCMPPGSVCCSQDADYCDPGQYCFINTSDNLRCCDEGETCTGTSTTLLAGTTIAGGPAVSSSFSSLASVTTTAPLISTTSSATTTPAVIVPTMSASTIVQTVTPTTSVATVTSVMVATITPSTATVTSFASITSSASVTSAAASFTGAGPRPTIGCAKGMLVAAAAVAGRMLW